MSQPAPELRIGNAERASAMKALDEHMSAGRLSIDEYGDRTAAASTATTRSELVALFSDLPAPHPVLPDPTAVGGWLPDRAGSATPATPATYPDRPVFGRWGPRLVALTPLVAVALFFATSGLWHFSWVFFLLVPAVGTLVHGGRRDRRHRRYRRMYRRELD